MNIGIDPNTGLVYEGEGTLGHPLWPTPILFQLKIASEGDREYQASKLRDLAPNSLLFREETYNSASRVRRGRVYQCEPSTPVSWSVYPHPAIAHEAYKARRRDGILNKNVAAFRSIRLQPHLDEINESRPIFILGAEHGFTIWSLINVETTATGDEVITLRARMSIGALPRLDQDAIKAADAAKAVEKIDKLEEDIFRAGPESVVDRSREAATAILSSYLQSNGQDAAGKDLAALARIAEEADLVVVANLAKVIARLHSRGKNAEQEKREIRQVKEHDAECAVQAIGVILSDLGWTHSGL